LIVSHLAFGRALTVEAAKTLNPLSKGKEQAKSGNAPPTPTRSSSWRWWWSSSTVPTVVLLITTKYVSQSIN
jgi:hypothetical protein